jgi:hypothetical protein
MSFESITIHRDFQIINGFVQLEPNYEADRTMFSVADVLAAFPTAFVVGMSQGSGRDTAAGFGQQQWVRIPGITNQDIWEFVTSET